MNQLNGKTFPLLTIIPKDLTISVKMKTKNLQIVQYLLYLLAYVSSNIPFHINANYGVIAFILISTGSRLSRIPEFSRLHLAYIIGEPPQERMMCTRMTRYMPRRARLNLDRILFGREFDGKLCTYSLIIALSCHFLRNERPEQDSLIWCVYFHIKTITPPPFHVCLMLLFRLVGDSDNAMSQ